MMEQPPENLWTYLPRYGAPPLPFGSRVYSPPPPAALNAPVKAQRKKERKRLKDAWF